ncbi:hypothetical protein [Bacillus chungangensis]|uniref:Skp family chaperone for outer membrane proteins n=1 Tax=Bacillus chungangensis TaxID=587633 RepID=A0ABT9WM50_9BACI|nr:hypothetical protein [Bacillus chungangensis]MDQ0174184.1 Skp family chaperone for outer membrane proteins [Bacillus chungangensis]
MESFLLLIIVAVISAIFNRVTNANKNEIETKNPESIEIDIPHTEPIERRIKQVVQKVPEKNEYNNIQKNILEKKQATEKQYMELKQKEARRSRQTSLKKQVEETQPKRQASFLLDSNDLVKGIVMAEVLGPPRAKKHYRRI